ncbi:MAG: hypothetical protein WCO71_11655, partial [Pseudomonadota bacterium]
TYLRPMPQRKDLPIGDVVIGEGDNDNHQFSFRIIAGKTTKDKKAYIRLEPGEVRIIGASETASGKLSGDRLNTVIKGDTKYSAESRAFYKMTPYAFPYKESPKTGGQYLNLARMTEAECFEYSFRRVTGAPAASNIQDFADMWGEVKKARALRDAFPGWDGTMKGSGITLPSGQKLNGLNSFVPTTTAITVKMRNEGYAGYRDVILGRIQDDSTQTPIVIGGETMVGRLRSAKVPLAGNQVWNFYLINSLDADGKELDPDRRWFGSPDTLQVGSNVPQQEGTATAPGWHLVDEPLLLNLQAMTSGWPMYGNGNHDWESIVQPPQAGMRWKNPSTEAEASYLVKTAEGAGSYKQPEVTGPKVNTLKQINTLQLLHSNDSVGSATKNHMFMMDLLVRSADMTEQTSPRSTTWYPLNTKSLGFEADDWATTSGYNST